MERPAEKGPECLHDAPPVVQVGTQEGQRVDKQVREEDGVHDDVGEDSVIERHNVVDGVRQAEEQVADEHRQHGSRGLVHHLAACRCGPCGDGG